MTLPQTFNNKPLIYAWAYLDSEGKATGYVARYQNGTDTKEIIPFFKPNKPNGTDFGMGIDLTPRPLFGLDRLAKHPKDKAVFVVEGEKAAAALQSIGLCAVTSLGGSQAASKSDWATLEGFNLVYLLPDNDGAGEGYIKDVYRALMALRPKPLVKLVYLPGLPDKGDIVDWLRSYSPDWDGFQPFPEADETWSSTELRAELKKAQPAPDEWSNASLNGGGMAQGDTLPPGYMDDTNLCHDYPVFNDSDFYGIAGEVARLGSEQSEADPVAVYFYFFTAAAALIGQDHYFQIGDARHNARLNVALVGASSRSRKGTSFNPVKRIIRKTEEIYERISDIEKLVITNGGLSSAEGLVWAVRDEAEETKGKNNEPIWNGVQDKRLLVVEEELAQVFKVAKREGNTISVLLRTAWDGGTLSPMTKNNRLTATNPHINVLGHITQFELKSVLSSDDIYNGLVNRFLWACVRRQKILAFPEPMDDSKVYSIAIKLAGRVKKLIASENKEITLDAGAREYWGVQYRTISADQHGVIGVVTARSEAHTLRLAILFCLLDDCNVITTQHLKAAIAVINYSAASAEFIFTTPTDETPDAQRLLAALDERALTQTEISGLFGRNKNRVQLSLLLTELQTLNKIRKITTEGTKLVTWEKI